jgi:hypothetical protein
MDARSSYPALRYGRPERLLKAYMNFKIGAIFIIPEI